MRSTQSRLTKCKYQHLVPNEVAPEKKKSVKKQSRTSKNCEAVKGRLMLMRITLWGWVVSVGVGGLSPSLGGCFALAASASWSPVVERQRSVGGASQQAFLKPSQSRERARVWVEE